jgi:hypothetical protein
MTMKTKSLLNKRKITEMSSEPTEPRSCSQLEEEYGTLEDAKNCLQNEIDNLSTMSSPKSGSDLMDFDIDDVASVLSIESDSHLGKRSRHEFEEEGEVQISELTNKLITMNQDLANVHKNSFLLFMDNPRKIKELTVSIEDYEDPSLVRWFDRLYATRNIEGNEYIAILTGRKTCRTTTDDCFYFSATLWDKKKENGTKYFLDVQENDFKYLLTDYDVNDNVMDDDDDDVVNEEANCTIVSLYAQIAGILTEILVLKAYKAIQIGDPIALIEKHEREWSKKFCNHGVKQYKLI